MSLYGCQLWDYSTESVLASVFVTWRKCVRNTFSIPYNTHCNLVHLIAQDSSVRVKLQRHLKFFNSASKSNNTLVSMMSRIVINGSGSAACRSLNFICSIYDLSKYDISLSLLSKLKDFFFLRDREEFPHGKFIAESTCVQCLTSTHPTHIHSFTHLHICIYIMSLSLIMSYPHSRMYLHSCTHPHIHIIRK